MAQTSPQVLYEQLQAKQYSDLARETTFLSGGPMIKGSVRKIGSEYDIAARSYGEGRDITVFEPMRERLPQFLIDATLPTRSTTVAGVNSIPQFMVDKQTFGDRREEVAGMVPMFTPQSINDEWKRMWLTVHPGETSDMWGGTITRHGNQVTYKSINSCQKGCTFSLLDNPMAVAAHIPSIRDSWEKTSSLALNGDLEGVESDGFAMSQKPVTDGQSWASFTNGWKRLESIVPKWTKPSEVTPASSWVR